MTTEETHAQGKTLAGRPINGEIRYYARSNEEQRPILELVALLDEAFTHPEVKAIRWRAYTPYWNDGSPCVFHVSDCGFLFEGADENDGDHEDGFIEPSMVDWYRKEDNDPNYLSAITPKIVMATEKVEDALHSGHYNVELLEYFGDPAQVTATREGFDVEDYEHE